MKNKSNTLDVQTVNRKVQEIPPITTVDGSQLQFYSIFPDKNNAADEFQFTLPLQRPMEGSLLLDESRDDRWDKNLPSWSILLKW